MSPELELVQHWLLKAKNDLRGAQVDLSVDPPLVDDACFHCQQAVEKVLKAFLTYHGVEFEKTHELEYLLSLCADLNSSFVQWRNPCKPLSDYAVRTRYPYPGSPVSTEDVERALMVARNVWDFVTSLLPDETLPRC
jgi:HEPN domain-containing protein